MSSILSRLKSWEHEGTSKKSLKGVAVKSGLLSLSPKEKIPKNFQSTVGESTRARSRLGPKGEWLVQLGSGRSLQQQRCSVLKRLGARTVGSSHSAPSQVVSGVDNVQ